MATCDACGETTGLSHTCDYCGGQFCSRHRVPENHDCAEQTISQSFGGAEREIRAEGIETPEAMDPASVKKPSSTTKTGDATPDVNPDGSLAERSDDDRDQSQDSGQRWQWPSLTALTIRAKSWIMSVPRLVALAVVLLGAWNLVAAPIVGVELFTDYRQFGVLYGDRQSLPIFLGDVVVIAIGAVGVWITTRT